MSRISPERLFLDLALGKSDAGVTDNLGIALGLDVNTLYELSAEKCVQNHSYDRAIKLFKLAKVIFRITVTSLLQPSKSLSWLK